jgi:putative transposase
LAIAGIAGGATPISRIIISSTEHKSVQSAAAHAAELWEKSLSVVDVDRDGFVDVEPVGAVSVNECDRWVACRPGFFLPVRVLSRLYRRLFLEKLVAAHRAGKLQFFSSLTGLAAPGAFEAMLAPLRNVEWFVYAKRPFAGPEQVLAYLARYTHRVAISNHRLTAIEKGHVTFTWRDYRQGGRIKPMMLTAHEFLRRFLLHVLPDGFQRIRHYGFLANAHRRAKLALIRKLLPPAPAATNFPSTLQPEPAQVDLPQAPPCPCCGSRMQTIEILPGPRRSKPRLDSS